MTRCVSGNKAPLTWHVLFIRTVAVSSVFRGMWRIRNLPVLIIRGNQICKETSRIMIYIKSPAPLCLTHHFYDLIWSYTVLGRLFSIYTVFFLNMSNYITLIYLTKQKIKIKVPFLSIKASHRNHDLSLLKWSIWIYSHGERFKPQQQI